ncbi:MAG TPA: MBL fold metallo-hydrolase [Treponemataceae bacterium]|nr:MBL fold metallo-hydrolase [Treponemataceae bacterium]
MELEILGSGTSHGIPVIGCDCAVCASSDPRDNRLRASALIRADSGATILIDAGPEFRIQALRARIHRVDALLVTHTHADHIHGLDDLRIFTHERDLPVYGNQAAIDEIAERFSYIFRETQAGGGKPHISLIPVAETGEKDGEANTITVAGVAVTPIPLLHGNLEILGWRIGDTAYLTDCSALPERSFVLLTGVRNLIIDALRIRPHSTHFDFPQALEIIQKIGPERAWFTHICHESSHVAIERWIAENAGEYAGHQGKKIEPAYDGLRITIGQ